MNSKVVWIINQYGGSRLHGMTFRSYYLAKEFVKKHKVYLFSASYSHVMSNPPVISGNLTREDIDGISYAWLKVAKYEGSKSMGRIWSMLVFLFRLFTVRVSTFQKPDVIIVSSISPFPIIKAFFWARRYKAKLIFEVRDIWPLSIIELGGLSKYHPFVILLQWVENFAYRVSDYVVSVLPKALDHMQDHGLSKDRFVYIPNGIEISEMEQVESPERTAFVVGYAGTIGVANAMHYLIEAADLLKDYPIKFSLLGNGPDKKALKELVLQKSLENIQFYDAVPKAEVPLFLSNVDVLYIGWHHSELYRFGISANKIFDYLLAKKPIVHSVNAGNDPVQEAKAGISVAPENPQQIADAIVQLYQMSIAERKQMGENGRKYVEEHHSYEKLAASYERLFN
ncbi:MAG: glycosyltransferase WbuB [Flavobacteriales bacterium]|nr:glycosyltransferase WbuB [Flavobacteriales bacterium]|tara:strand:- start:618 stop:1808 length:1191 start_codon:yes stop_codon:yes gene_type:complete